MIIRDQKFEQLRFGIGSVGGERQAGVAVAMFDKIPAGSTVNVHIDLPTELNTNVRDQGNNGAVIIATLPAQGYVFEHAPEPGPYTAGGVVIVRGRNRQLVTNGLGKLTPRQEQPAWAAFAPAVSGAIKQKGRLYHTFTTPGTAALTPNLAPENRHLVRLRWTATAVAGEAVGVGTGISPQTLAGRCGTAATPKTNIAPGSVVIHATIGGVASLFRDDGRGRLVGGNNTGSQDADGTIDYLTGIYTITFFTAPDGATAVTIDYEHSCRYQPLDCYLEYDALMAS